MTASSNASNNEKDHKQITVTIDLKLNNKFRDRLAKLGLMNERGNLTLAIEAAITCFLNETDTSIKSKIATRVDIKEAKKR